MDNGFTIDSISYEETSVEVSNGSRKYKLILSGLNMKIDPLFLEKYINSKE